MKHRKQLDHVPLAEILERDIGILAKSLMAPSVLERHTHLINVRVYLSAGTLCIYGSINSQFKQPEIMNTRISFCENKKSLLRSMTTLIIMGRTLFCLRTARKLRDALAFEEAGFISRWGIPLPDGARGDSGSAYAAALLTAKAKLDKQKTELLHETLAVRIMFLCQQRIRSALDAGLTHLAIQHTTYQDGLITVDAHCA